MRFAKQIVDAVIVAGVRAVVDDLIFGLQDGVSPRNFEQAALLRDTITFVDDELYIPVAVEVARAVPMMSEKIPHTLAEMDIVRLAGRIFTEEEMTKCPEVVVGCWHTMEVQKGQPTA